MFSINWTLQIAKGNEFLLHLILVRPWRASRNEGKTNREFQEAQKRSQKTGHPVLPEVFSLALFPLHRPETKASQILPLKFHCFFIRRDVLNFESVENRVSRLTGESNWSLTEAFIGSEALMDINDIAFIHSTKAFWVEISLQHFLELYDFPQCVLFLRVIKVRTSANSMGDLGKVFQHIWIFYEFPVAILEMLEHGGKITGSCGIDKMMGLEDFDSHPSTRFIRWALESVDEYKIVSSSSSKFQGKNTQGITAICSCSCVSSLWLSKSSDGSRRRAGKGRKQCQKKNIKSERKKSFSEWVLLGAFFFLIFPNETNHLQKVHLKI